MNSQSGTNEIPMSIEDKILAGNGVYEDHTPSKKMYDAIVKSMHDFVDYWELKKREQNKGEMIYENT